MKPSDTAVLGLLPGDVTRAAALRRSLLDGGAPAYELRATPTDLAKFGLSRWEGTFCGIECVDSPIKVVPR